jgi:toxin ParE1/3/4
MNSYSFSAEAVLDLDEICEYIAQENPCIASQLFDAIRQKCKLIADFPGHGEELCEAVSWPSRCRR